MLATGSVPKSLPGLELDGERVISSDAGAPLRPGAQLGDRPRRRGHRRRVRQRVALVRGRRHDRRDAAAPAAAGGRVQRQAAERAFRRRGIGFELGARFESVKHTDSGVPVTLEGGKTLDAELLLVAVGRGPVSADLGYEEAGVEMERGFVKVDEYCRTSVPTISAVGDLIADPAAGARRLRRGHPGGRAHRRPRGAPDRLRRRAPDHLLRPRGRLGRIHRRAGRGPRATRSWTFTYDLAGNGRSVILQTQGAVKVIAAKNEDGSPAACSASTWSATGSASSSPRPS